MKQFDEKGVVSLLKKLVETPSPSGYTERVMEVIQAELNDMERLSRKRIKVPLLQLLKGKMIHVIVS